jgi:hypothetical protein
MTFDQLLNLASDQLTEQGRLELIESRILTNPDGIVLQKLISKEDTLKMLAAYKEYLTPEATCVMEIVNNNNIHDCAYVLLSVKDAVEQLAAVLGVFFHPNIVHGTL